MGSAARGPASGAAGLVWRWPNLRLFAMPQLTHSCCPDMGKGDRSFILYADATEKKGASPLAREGRKREVWRMAAKTEDTKKRESTGNGRREGRRGGGGEETSQDSVLARNTASLVSFPRGGGRGGPASPRPGPAPAGRPPPAAPRRPESTGSPAARHPRPGAARAGAAGRRAPPGSQPPRTCRPGSAAG